MPARRIEITVSEETWGRLNAARGHEPRASFVKRALESALGREPHDALSRALAAPGPLNADFVVDPGPGLKPAGQTSAERQAKPKLPAGVKTAREFVLDPRQAALNKAKKS